ncbi:MAG: RNA polymerase sigma factor [Clostridia bacterium]|nr:RNA polymerase sigma factor [Clostridia bacterium]
MDKLITRFKNGDKSAFEEIVKRLQNQLLLIAKSRLNNQSLADDVVQETFICLFKNARKIKNVSKFKSWITIVLINKCNKLMKQKKIVEISYDQENFENFLQTEQEYENITNNIDFINYISFLNIEERTIISMFYSQNYTIKEIAEILKLSENTIKSKILRAKNKIKNRLGGRENGQK